MIYLNGFTQSKKLISYKDSKLFKKGIKIKFVLEDFQCRTKVYLDKFIYIEIYILA
jgi:hypothetical protein